MTRNGDGYSERDFVGEALREAGITPDDVAERKRQQRTKKGREPHLLSQCAADITPRRIDFLWPGRIARGKHTAIAGESGIGKSQLSVFVAAMVSRGGEWPCNEGRAPVGNTLILNAEDGADDTLVPRLIAAGADLKRVHIVNAVLQEDGKGRRTFNLQSDLALLERKIAEIGDVVLVIIDPISSYMGNTDSHKNAEVRGALEPLSEMATRLKVAVLSITHFSKSGAGINTKALHRFIGSIAFVGAPRAAFAVIEDPDAGERLLLLHAKNNMARKQQGLAYRLVQIPVGEQNIIASYIVWDGEPVQMSADEALRANEDSSDRKAITEALEFLQGRLSSGAEVRAKEAEDYAREALMISPRTLDRARKKLGVKARRESEGGEGKGKWWWSLPPAAEQPQERQWTPKDVRQENGVLGILAKEDTEDATKDAKDARKSDGALAPELAPLGDTPSTPPKTTADPPSSSRAPSEDKTCAQCQGSVDGKERLVEVGGAKVWLHRECERFYLRENPPEVSLCAHCGEPGNVLNNPLMRDRHGRLIHRTCRDEADLSVPQERSLH
jgi:RecA-family ATPase